MFKLFKKSTRKAFTAPIATVIKSADVFDYVCNNYPDDWVVISDEGDELLRTYASYAPNIPEEIELHFCYVTPSEYCTNFA